MEIKTEDKPKFFTMTIDAADMHQGHLSPEIATTLVEEDER